MLAPLLVDHRPQLARLRTKSAAQVERERRERQRYYRDYGRRLSTAEQLVHEPASGRVRRRRL